MDKTKNLDWFVELMKNKMMKHEDEDPLEMKLEELIVWLADEMQELVQALVCETKEEVLLECADVANLVYFIASWLKERGK